MIRYPAPPSRSTTTTGARKPTRSTESMTRFTCASLALRWCEMTSSFAMGRTSKCRPRRLAGSLNASPPSGSGREDRAERSAISTGSYRRRSLGPLRVPLPAEDDPAHERGLARVLIVVVDHAHEPDAERHGRIPRLVHD